MNRKQRQEQKKKPVQRPEHGVIGSLSAAAAEAALERARTWAISPAGTPYGTTPDGKAKP
jgi:hypothetical protein